MDPSLNRVKEPVVGGKRQLSQMISFFHVLYRTLLVPSDPLYLLYFQSPDDTIDMWWQKSWNWWSYIGNRRVENGSQRFFKNLLAIVLAIKIHRLGTNCKKKQIAPKSFSGHEIHFQKWPNHWKVKFSRRLSIGMWRIYPEARDWNVGALCSDLLLGERILSVSW